MIKRDFHIHSTYCDGKDSLEEIVIKAVEKEFEAIGFSSHAPIPFENDYAMKKEDVLKYVEEIAFLKKKYSGQIEIFCGTELDYFSEIDTSLFDYTIGSVHTIYKDGVWLEVDFSKERLLADVDKYYNGDIYSYIADYYKLVGDIRNKHNPDIIGHLDLVSKFNENLDIFKEDEKYLDIAYNAIDKLTETPAVFEINTGAISRGYRTEPYPSIPLLKRIMERGGKIIINSDGHRKEDIGFCFEEAEDYIKKTGVSL